MSFDPLFRVGRIGNLELKNRIVKSSQATATANPDGTVTQRTVNHYKRLAEGGVGLVMVEYSYVDDDAAKALHNQIGVSRREHVAGLGWLVDEVHAAGAKIGLQIAHGGRQKFLATAPIKSASDVSWDEIERQYGVRPTPMTREEIDGVVHAFGDAAARAVAARFDVVEVHAGHGYLITNFLSPHTNRRTDEYGGSFENRARLLLSIVREIRLRIGYGVPLNVRLSVVDYEPDGITIEETVELCRLLEQAGVTAIHASGGHHAGMEYEVSPWYMPRALHRWGWEKIREAVKIPVIASGSLVSPGVASEILASGSADFVSLGRAMLADPDWANKARENRPLDIVPCIRCNDGCLHRGLNEGRSTGCTVNPSMANEYKFTLEPVKAPQRVAVVGGGPAGLNAATVLARRGYRVTLYEAEELGGKLGVATRSPRKQDAAALLAHLLHQAKHPNIEVVKARATVDLLRQGGFARVVLATGSKPRKPDWKADGKLPTVLAAGLKTADELQGPIVVVGGGLTGCDTALWLAQSGRADVTLVEAESGLLSHGEVFTDVMGMPGLLDQAGVKVELGATVCGQDTDGVWVREGEAEPRHIGAATLVLATGYEPDGALLEQLQRELPGVEAIRIGTARAGSRLFDALHDAFFATRLL
ncbi:NAD(P)/FAD-dependent oxidoreductase [Paraburkholderia sp. HP33-1]|uniref:NAD(P)/FAD-dependent oxidoreductase n=1 Tax=Paraburkholderia sp. HP33-1 TaxID=2883243 RepID=UPI001F22D6E5|nr:NAD(P)/FAD-dependent oxidoreductase [Paraburkholderia sp. HP33-1]